MGWIARLLDRVEAKIEKPADPGVLEAERNAGSETAVDPQSPETATEAARRVRRERARRRWRWGAGR